VTTETKVSRYAIEHFTTKAKQADFRPMFHREPAGIRSASYESEIESFEILTQQGEDFYRVR